MEEEINVEVGGGMAEALKAGIAEAMQGQADVVVAEEEIVADVDEVANEEADIDAEVDDAESEEEPEADDADEAEEDEPEELKLDAPSVWKKEDKEAWDKVPDEYKGILLKQEKFRNADYTKKTQALAEERKEYKPLVEKFTPYTEALARSGHTVSSYVESLMDIDKRVTANPTKGMIELTEKLKLQPAEFTKALIEQYGLSASELGLSGDDTDYLTDEERAEKAHYRKIEAENKRLKAQGEQNQEITQRQEVQRIVDAFAAEEDDGGNLKHPYFDDALEDIQAIMLLAKQRGAALTLEQAYEKSSVVKLKKAETEKNNKDEDSIVKKRQQVAVARKKGRSANGSTTASGKVPNREEMIRSGIREQLTASN